MSFNQSFQSLSSNISLNGKDIYYGQISSTSHKFLILFSQGKMTYFLNWSFLFFFASQVTFHSVVPSNVNNIENVANNKYFSSEKKKMFFCVRKILFLHLLSLKIEHSPNWCIFEKLTSVCWLHFKFQTWNIIVVGFLEFVIFS